MVTCGGVGGRLGRATWPGTRGGRAERETPEGGRSTAHWIVRWIDEGKAVSESNWTVGVFVNSGKKGFKD